MAILLRGPTNTAMQAVHRFWVGLVQLAQGVGYLGLLHLQHQPLHQTYLNRLLACLNCDLPVLNHRCPPTQQIGGTLG